jgi:hypothetical protein
MNKNLKNQVVFLGLTQSFKSCDMA